MATHRQRHGPALQKNNPDLSPAALKSLRLPPYRESRTCPRGSANVRGLRLPLLGSGSDFLLMLAFGVCLVALPSSLP